MTCVVTPPGRPLSQQAGAIMPLRPWHYLRRTRVKKLVDGDRWNDRWWIKCFDQDMVTVACWLWDHADRGGFVEMDLEDVSEQGYLSLAKATEAYRRLCKPYKGYGRLYERKGDSPEKTWVWLRNYVKVQLNGMRFHEPKYNDNGRLTNSPMEVAMAKELYGRREEFPEVKAYLGYDTLAKASIGYHSLNKIKKKKISSLSSLGGEGSGGNPESEELQLARRLREQMEAEGRGCHQSITVEALTKIIRDRPDMDFVKMVNYVIGKDLNDGVNNTYGFLGKLCMDAKWRLSAGETMATADLKRLEDAEIDAINHKHDMREITDDEATELQRANTEKYAKLREAE